MAESSAILFRNERGTVWLLDLPRSIEESQVPSGAAELPPRRLRSSRPPAQPFQTPEPRDGRWQAASAPQAQVRELMALASVNGALDELRTGYSGPWCLPRVILDEDDDNNDKPAEEGAPDGAALRRLHTPEHSHSLAGTIMDLRAEFLQTAPVFDLIILDPPWPNRSARRKRKGRSNNYSTAADTAAVRELLSLVPVGTKLSPDGVIAIWVTNKPAFTEMLTAPRGGIFAVWGVELVDSWTWLKVTTAGEPIFDVESHWRKPWEQLLIATRPDARRRVPHDGRVLVAVPDVHSRKPNLRPVFGEFLGDGYAALEVFARNLTAGWWSWGDQVLHFQDSRHWAEKV